jgi:hypothetical protein
MDWSRAREQAALGVLPFGIGTSMCGRKQERDDGNLSPSWERSDAVRERGSIPQFAEDDCMNAIPMTIILTLNGSDVPRKPRSRET